MREGRLDRNRAPARAFGAAVGGLTTDAGPSHTSPAAGGDSGPSLLPGRRAGAVTLLYCPGLENTVRSSPPLGGELPANPEVRPMLGLRPAGTRLPPG